MVHFTNTKIFSLIGLPYLAENLQSQEATNLNSKQLRFHGAHPSVHSTKLSEASETRGGPPTLHNRLKLQLKG